ncbi:hypothetical protein M3Y99_01684900 [Aphelenchoides fujianensis]|nr:hypothetical protein M3Y99_01684900 [Aphelenchoides fujianensis]
MHGHTPLLVLLAVLVGSALAGKPKSGGSAGAGQFTTAPQCKCKDIQDCAHDLLEKTNNPQCEPFIKKIGNSGKIRACLDKEQKEMEKLEKCVEKKVGPVGCTNDEHPKNLTIPMMPQMDQAQMEAQMAAQPTQPGQAPAEMGQYLMCVDNCAMQALERDSKGHRRQRRSSSPNCANKLRSVPVCKTLTQMQYKNSADRMELTLNFRTGEGGGGASAELPLLHRPAASDPKFPLLSDKHLHSSPSSSSASSARSDALFGRAKPPFILKHTKKHNRGKHRHGHREHGRHAGHTVLLPAHGSPIVYDPHYDSESHEHNHAHSHAHDRRRAGRKKHHSAAVLPVQPLPPFAHPPAPNPYLLMLGKRSPLCALAPPDQKTQSAFEACERELNLEPQKRFKASCECLKGAGVKIECPK